MSIISNLNDATDEAVARIEELEEQINGMEDWEYIAGDKDERIEELEDLVNELRDQIKELEAELSDLKYDSSPEREAEKQIHYETY